MYRQGVRRRQTKRSTFLVRRLRSRPLLLFPEGGLTEGAGGLLEYHKFVFSLGVPVQVLALTVKPGPLPLSVNNELGTTIGNLACAFFVPCSFDPHTCITLLALRRGAKFTAGRYSPYDEASDP